MRTPYVKLPFALLAIVGLAGCPTRAQPDQPAAAVEIGAHDEVPDKQGRVTIPGHLREYAGLDRELVVIGASSRVEIWDKQSWDSYLAESEEDFVAARAAGEAADGHRHAFVVVHVLAPQETAVH